MRTILLVDDDPLFMREAGNMLTDAGYRVVQASDGLRAVRLIEEMREGIDLAIVDLAIPGVNGFELIGCISRRPNSIKVLATSGVYQDLQLESTTALGAHAAIRKPRSPQSLPRSQWLGTVQKLIGTP
jgi:two-component system, cell cycle sensor histidine kinase and response regulator CckA